MSSIIDDNSLKLCLPRVQVDLEPIFVGFLPSTANEKNNFEYAELIHSGEEWVDAEYFSRADTPKRKFSRNIVQFVLSSIKFYGQKLPLHSRVQSCEIIYENFSIKEVRTSCKYVSAYDFGDRIINNRWESDPPPISYADIYNETPYFDLPDSEKYYFIYNSEIVAKISGRRRSGIKWNLPEQASAEHLRDKRHWTLPY